MTKRHLTKFVILLVPLSLLVFSVAPVIMPLVSVSSKPTPQTSVALNPLEFVEADLHSAESFSDGAARSPASFESAKVEKADGDPSLETEEVTVTTASELASLSANGVPYIAATTNDLKSHPNVESLIQSRADSICEQLGVLHKRPHHRCKTFQIKNVEDSSNDRVLIDPLSSKTLTDRPNSVSFKTKSDYCKTSYAQEKDDVFCEQSVSSHEAQTLHPKKFTQVTCLLRETPFPREPNRVRRIAPSNSVSDSRNIQPSHTVRATQ